MIVRKFLLNILDSFFHQEFGILEVIAYALEVPISTNQQTLLIDELTFLLIELSTVSSKPSHLANNIAHSLQLESYLAFHHLQ